MTNLFFEKILPRTSDKIDARLNIRWQRWVLPMGVFLVALLPRLLDLSVFLTADEDDQIMFAHFYLRRILNGQGADIFFLGYPGIPTLILGTASVALRYAFHYVDILPLSWVTNDLSVTLTQMTARWAMFDYPLDFLWWVRVPLALMAALSILGIFLLARRLLDERLALLAVLIIAFDPFILAHTRVIHVDAPMSYFMFLCFLAFILYLDRGGWKWFALTGLFGVLAVLSKTAAAILAPILVVSGILYILLSPPDQSRRARWKRLGLAVVVSGLLAVSVAYIFWPTVEKLIYNIQSVNRGAHPTSGVFWTAWQSDQNPFYYLWVFPFHLTPLTTIGLLAGLAMMVAGLIAYSRRQNNWLTQVLPLAMGLGVYIVIFIAVTSTISRRGDRYILPVYFAAGMLAALGLWWLVHRFAKFFCRLKMKPIYVLGGVVLLQAFFVLWYHPYYFSYFNPLLGGYRTAPYWINVGWGEGLDMSADYLNEIVKEQESADSLPFVASWYGNQFAPFYHGPTIDLSDQSAALIGEYTVFYINQVQRGYPSKEILTYFQQRDPLKIIKIGGIPYAWIYKGPVVDQTAPQDYAFPVESLLGGGARLIGLDIPQTNMRVDDYQFSAEEKAWAENHPYSAVEGIPITLYWETVGEIRGHHNIYVRLLDEQGVVWGQVDRMILAGLWRPDNWYTGYFLRDEYKLPINSATPPGTYHLEVGMYDFVSGESAGVAKNIGQITLTPPERIPQPADIDVQTQLLLPVNEALTVIGHNYIDVSRPPGAEIAGKIFWQVIESIDTEYKVEFSLLDKTRQEEYIVAEKKLSASYPSSQWRPSETVAAAYRFRIPPVAPPGEYPLALNVIDVQTGERVGTPVTLANIAIEALDRNFDLPKNVTPISAVINDEIELVGYKLIDQSITSGEKFKLALYWRSLRFAQENYTVFVHAVGPDQLIRGQWDSVPAQGDSPTGGWIPGEIIEDYYEVPMVKDTPPWKYDIFVGMYDPVTGQRLNMASSQSPVSDNRAWLTRLQVMEDE